MFNFIHGVKVFLSFYLVTLFLLIFFVGITVPRASELDSASNRNDFINEATINLNIPPKLNIKQPIIMPPKPEYKNKTLFFVGDTMLDRGVEALIKKNKNFNYPFEQIQPFLKKADIVFANLEGPIVKNPPYNGEHSLIFAFDPQVVGALNFANINLVSLANNHILNMGENGYKQTKEFLTQGKISYIGGPTKCLKDSYVKDDLLFLAFNKTFSACTDDEIVKIIVEIEKSNKDKLLIVSIHWGNEYKLTNSPAQQKLGHLMIDAGADLIIGHHPHVVQNVELYKNKLIFYSLGNFVFDQYFSQNTQEGLVVQFVVGEAKLVYSLHPLQLSFSQPHLMDAKSTSDFLANLAKRSSQELVEQIKKGTFEIKR